MPKQNSSDVRLDLMRTKLIADVDDLWGSHIEQALEILEASESKKVKLTFGVSLDFSESKAIQEIELAFSQVFKDKRTSSFEDPEAPAVDDNKPAEPPLPGMTKVKRGKLSAVIVDNF